MKTGSENGKGKTVIILIIVINFANNFMKGFRWCLMSLLLTVLTFSGDLVIFLH